jgi:hypothetical protein
MGQATKKTKEKPALRLVPAEDPELFQADLDWFYGCFDSECGLRSAEGGIADSLADGAARARRSVATVPSCDKCGSPTSRGQVGLKCTRCPHTQAEQVVPVKHGGGGSGGSKSDPYSERQAGFAGEGVGSFTKGRRIHNRIVGLPWSIQVDIKLLYEPRRVPVTLSEDRVRAANRAYMEAARV